MIVDAALLYKLNAAASTHPLLRAIAVFSATHLLWFMGVAVLWITWRKRSVLALVFALLLVFAINYTIAGIAFRARPHEGIIELIARPHSLKAFPSDHVALATAFSWIVFLFMPKAGIAMAVGALLVGFGRVAVGVHYPTDILGGIVTGSVAAWIARLMVR